MLPTLTTYVVNVEPHVFMTSQTVHFPHPLHSTMVSEKAATEAVSTASELSTSAVLGKTRSVSSTSSGSSSVGSVSRVPEVLHKRRRKRDAVSHTSQYDNSSPRCAPHISEDADETADEDADAMCSSTELRSLCPPPPKRMRAVATSASAALFFPRGPGPPAIESPGYVGEEIERGLFEMRPMTIESSDIMDTTDSVFSELVTKSNQMPPKFNITPSLPDEVLTSILRFIPTANGLAKLRLVCRQWCNLIDTTPLIWRGASFRHTRFGRCVKSVDGKLTLGDMCGRRVLEIAAKSGNEWGRFLHRTLLETGNLKAFTVPQPLATLLTAGKIARTERTYPPWGNMKPQNSNSDDLWLAVHAARGGSDMMPTNATDGSTCRAEDMREWPRGAVVGLIHVVKTCMLSKGGHENFRWIWHIDRAVGIRRPLRCAGFLGVWTMSTVLTELIISAVQSQ